MVPAQLPHLAIVHTAESLPDFTLPDTSGESLARYASTTTRRVSWHSTVDSDGTLPMIPDSYTGFHVVGYNRCAVGMEIATKASLWSSGDPVWKKAILDKAANQVAWWCRTYNLDVDRLTKTEADQGRRGIMAHADLDPLRRTDPGPAFPWADFLTDVSVRLTPGGYIDKHTWPAYAVASIEKAITKGVMVNDGKFWLPERVVTRAEIAVILDRLGLL